MAATLDSDSDKDNHTDCDVGWILLRALECLETENAKLRSGKSHPVMLSESESLHDSPERTHFGSHRNITIIGRNHTPV